MSRSNTATGWWQVPHFEIVAASGTLQLSYEMEWLACHCLPMVHFSQVKCGSCFYLLYWKCSSQETDGLSQVRCVKRYCCFRKQKYTALGWPRHSAGPISPVPVNMSCFVYIGTKTQLSDAPRPLPKFIKVVSHSLEQSPGKECES